MPFWKGWYSHKFKGPGLRYEVAVSILSDDIVWTNGPFPAGKFADITIFRRGLKQMLEAAGERCEADAGYKGEPLTIELPDEGIFFGVQDDQLQQGELQRKLKDRIRSRHESVNGRLKCFGCLEQRFRHKLCYHRFCFNAVVAIVQIGMQYGGEVLMEIDEYKTQNMNL